MFNFLKIGRKAAKIPTEADFDVIKGMELNGVFFTKSEIWRLYLAWTDDSMQFLNIASMLPKYIHNFGLKVAGQDQLAISDTEERTAEPLLAKFVKVGLMTAWGGKPSHSSTYKLTWRGEQVRQFIVMKSGLCGFIVSRHHLFVGPAAN